VAVLDRLRHAPAREREAAQIAEDFGSDRWCDALDRKVSERTYSNRGL